MSPKRSKNRMLLKRIVCQHFAALITVKRHLFYSPSKRSEEGFLLVLYRIAPVPEDFPSPIGALDLPGLA